MSQHLIDGSRVLYPEQGQHPEAVPSGQQDKDDDGGPGAMRQPGPPREATVSEMPRPRPAEEPALQEVGGEEVGGDASLAALDALRRALAEIAEEQRLLEAKLEELRRHRASGREWRDILPNEEPPGSMQMVSQMLASLAKASGTLRKELVENLRREGVSIPAIARMFGVTHQRVSNLLRRPSD